MSHYQQPAYYAPPSTGAPIQSSFYAARQRFEQPAQAKPTPPHLRPNAHDYRQYPSPPRHPLQQGGFGGQHQQGGPSGAIHRQAQPPPQLQQPARPQSHYGAVQQYQQPYAQAGQGYGGHVSPGQYPVQSVFNPAQYAQKMFGHSPMEMPFQPRPQPTPAQAFSAYEAFNAREQQRSAAAVARQQQELHQQQHHQQPQQHQQQHLPRQPQFAQLQQAQPVQPVAAPQMAASMSAPSAPMPQVQPPTGTSSTPSRRPLPQPVNGGLQARPRPMSMPPQMHDPITAPTLHRPGHSSSTSLSNVIPQSSVGLTSSLPHTSAFSSSPAVSTATRYQVPLKTDAQSERAQSPDKSVPTTVAPTQGTLVGPTQRRALPPSPTTPPDLSQLRNRNNGVMAKSAPHSPIKAATSLSVSPSSLPQAPRLLTSRRSDREDQGEQLSADEQDSNSDRGCSPSPQYGILDLPKRTSQIAIKLEPSSPQYGIKELPSRTKSVVERRKAWERAEQGMADSPALSKPASPTRSIASPSVPIASARSPQPQQPKQMQKLPMPVVRQPQPSRTERTPSWTLPTADLGKLATVGDKKPSMAFRFATMSLEEENTNDNKASERAGTSHHEVRRPLQQKSMVSQPKSPAKQTRPYPLSTHTSRRSVNMDLSLDDAPPPSIRRSPSPSTSTASSSVPSIPMIKTPEDQCSSVTSSVPMIPQISLPGDLDLDDALSSVPSVKVKSPTTAVSHDAKTPSKASVPLINLPDDDMDTDNSAPVISVCAAAPQTSNVPMPVILDDLANTASQTKSRGLPRPPNRSNTAPLPPSHSSSSNVRSRGGGLMCGGCHQSIIGRIVSAMGLRWHPQCFKCCTCGEYLEHVSSYEHDGKPYCHLDYHELFAPKCYSCQTPIIDERFITLDDPALGKRTYHEQHFFCAECGDPFLAPSLSAPSKRSGPNEISIKGDGAFDVALDVDGDEVGFTVFRGHPYCEACHVRLRAPKCKACKKSIRDGMRAVEALGGKWCYECFVCTSCQKPFEEPSFFQRDKKPFCEHCFSIILRNEL